MALKLYRFTAIKVQIKKPPDASGGFHKSYDYKLKAAFTLSM